MCMPFLDRLLSSGQRRRNSVTITPRPSLAPTPQQSSATIQTVNTTTVVASKNDTSLPVKISLNPVAHVSDDSLMNSANINTAQPGGSRVPQVPSATASRPSKPASWWEYFGMNKNKKGSVDSL